MAKVSITKWPSALRNNMAAATGPRAWEEAENAERGKRLAALKSCLREACLPNTEISEGPSSGQAAWHGIGQGLRARTLRRRVRDWQKATRFLRSG